MQIRCPVSLLVSLATILGGASSVAARGRSQVTSYTANSSSRTGAQAVRESPYLNSNAGRNLRTAPRSQTQVVKTYGAASSMPDNIYSVRRDSLNGKVQSKFPAPHTDIAPPSAHRKGPAVHSYGAYQRVDYAAASQTSTGAAASHSESILVPSPSSVPSAKLGNGGEDAFSQGTAEFPMLQGAAESTTLQGKAESLFLKGGASNAFLQGGTSMFLSGQSGIAQQGLFDKIQPELNGQAEAGVPFLRSQIRTDSLNTGLNQGKFGLGTARVAPLGASVDDRRLTGGTQSILFKAFEQMNCVEFNQLAANYYTADVNYRPLNVGYQLSLPGFGGGRVKVYTNGQCVIAIEPKSLDTWVARAGSDLGIRSNWRKLIHMK